MRIVPTVGCCLLALTLASPFAAAGPVRAVTKAAPPSVREKAARDTLARLEGEAGWKERIRALVSLSRAGPDAVGPLVETLQKGSPRNRTFAAHVLGILA